MEILQLKKSNGGKNTIQWINLRLKGKDERIGKLQENYINYPSRENRKNRQEILKYVYYFLSYVSVLRIKQ